jgi:transposase-like protein
MKNPVYEQIQARKVKARLRMLQHAQRISGNVSQTCRFFGVSRALFYIWKERYEKHGVANPSHSGGASLRRRSSQSLSATALSRLRFADDHSEDLSSSSRWPRFAEEVSSRPKTTGCTSAGSRPLCPTRCEVCSPCGKSASALLSIHGYRRSDAISRPAHLRPRQYQDRYRLPPRGPGSFSLRYSENSDR